MIDRLNLLAPYYGLHPHGSEEQFLNLLLPFLHIAPEGLAARYYGLVDGDFTDVVRVDVVFHPGFYLGGRGGLRGL